MRLVSSIVVGFTLLLSGCSTSTTSGVKVVVTTNILGSVVSEIVSCGGGSTEVLMPIGTSAHDFSLSSRQVADMATADFVVLNGLGLERGLEKVLQNVKAEGAEVFEVGDSINPLEVSADGGVGEHSHEVDHDHGEFDPHFWLDMSRMAMAANAIGEKLAKITGEDVYRECAASVSGHILASEAELKETLESIPSSNRLLVVDHESFNYFADAYNFEIIGSIIPSISDNAQPSSEELAALVEIIQERNVKAIFVGSDNTKKLAYALRSEIGRAIDVVKLYEGSLGTKNTGAETYIEMMMFNARAISKALS